MVILMTERYPIRSDLWLDPDNDPNDARLLFAKKTLGLFEDISAVDFTRGKPMDLSGMVFPDLSSAQLLAFDTGGTSGKTTQVIHSTDTLDRAVEGLQAKIGPKPISSVCCLPLHHLGGWMQVHRAIRTSGSVFFCSYRDLGEERLGSKLKDRWLSLVPTQLFHLLKSPQAVKNLRKAKGIFVGGAAMSAKLTALCRKETLPVWPTYGMSETAGMITLLSADEFLNGREGVGKVLPHADLCLPADRSRISVAAKSLCLAKPPDAFGLGDSFQTEDYGEVDRLGYWKLLGRGDRVIVTGGEKVDPGFVEKIILDTGLVEQCLIMGIKDEKWGQRVIAYLSPSAADLSSIKDIVRETVSGANYPKEWILTDELPLSEMGKPLA
jgi:O-succinylbenzoic acid--CoA ligase